MAAELSILTTYNNAKVTLGGDTNIIQVKEDGSNQLFVILTDQDFDTVYLSDGTPLQDGDVVPEEYYSEDNLDIYLFNPVPPEDLIDYPITWPLEGLD